MYTQIQTLILALAATPLVSAHGKIAVVTGDQGGNGTALGIKGAVVPGAGPNYMTETDTTVFWSKDINTDDDIGYTEGGNGNNELDDLNEAMAQSGSTLPQVSSGGKASGTFHIVTSDGAGPLQALIDETATAKWSQAKQATVSTQVPGTDGFVDGSEKRGLMHKVRRGLVKMGLMTKRADNVNKDYVSSKPSLMIRYEFALTASNLQPFAIDIPAGTSCTGTISGQSNVCLIKVSNNNEDGPFGGVFAVQMGGSSANSTSSARPRRTVKFYPDNA